jgi:CTP:molybdopterin cytidylyltransferase MocA
MIESILAGLTIVEHADPGLAGLMLCPVDSARAAEVAYTWLDQARAAHPSSNIVPEFAEKTGHPAWLVRAQWKRLRSVECLRHGARAALEEAQRWRVDDSKVLDNVNERP